jgi:hypothetical protein
VLWRGEWQSLPDEEEGKKHLYRNRPGMVVLT